MTGSPLPLEPLEDSAQWLGGEAHVRHLGGSSRAMHTGHRIGGPYGRLALALAFLGGGLVGAALTGLAWRAQYRGRAAR
jgi:hypothetical protein